MGLQKYKVDLIYFYLADSAYIIAETTFINFEMC